MAEAGEERTSPTAQGHPDVEPSAARRPQRPSRGRREQLLAGGGGRDRGGAVGVAICGSVQCQIACSCLLPTRRKGQIRESLPLQHPAAAPGRNVCLVFLRGGVWKSLSGNRGGL